MYVVWPINLSASDLQFGATPTLGSYPLWDAETTYEAGDRVKTDDDRIWEAPITSYALGETVETNLNRDPSLAGAGFLAPYGAKFAPRSYIRPNPQHPHFWWTTVEPTDSGSINEYFMLSPPLYRKTSLPSPMAFTISPRFRADSLALFALTATGVTVNGVMKAKPEHLRHLLFTDVTFPAEVVVTANDNAEVGYLCAGNFSNVGLSEYGTELGFKDYSHKPRQFDGDGSINIIERDYSDTVSFKVQTETKPLRQTMRFLAQLRSMPAAYIAHPNLPETLTFGYYQDFQIPISDYSTSELSLSVEGLV